MADRAVPPSDIHPADFFTRWVPESVASDAERRSRLVDTVAVLQFELEATDGEEGGVYHLAIHEGVVRGREGGAERVDLRVRLDVTTWRMLNSGELTAPEAFLRRRVRLHGNLALAVKLHFIMG